MIISGRKKTGILVSLVLASVIAYASYYAVLFARIAASFSAKTMCSCVFISGRSPASVESEELHPIPKMDLQIDWEKQTVKADFYSLINRTAIYRKGLGCTLLNGVSEVALRKQPYPEQDTLQEQDQKMFTIQTEDEVDKRVLRRLTDSLFIETDPEHPLRTRAVVILYKGRLLTEKYAKGYSSQTPLMGWSMAKSVTNAMVGLLVKDGFLDVKQVAPVAEWANDERRNITLDHLLRMTSGLNFEEDFSKPGKANQMLFGSKNAAAIVIPSEIAHSPAGSFWSYSTGTTNILQHIIRKQFSTHAQYLDFPHKRLFQKIGMRTAILEPDPSGTYIGSSFMYASARDWARFGQLYLQDGVWQGERILPEGWVKYSSAETIASDGKYAAHFWVNHRDKDFPEDAFFASGHEGQFVTIVPSKQLVIVRMGCTAGRKFDNVKFVKGVVAAVR